VHRREIANPAKRCTAIAGTQRALLANMYDADAIEAINFEQLATTTDRLLLRRGHVAKYRPSDPSPVPPTLLARGSHAHIEQSKARRPAPSSHSQVFAITVVIPTLAGIAAGLAAML
jgi:hypothetical protein